MPKPLPPIISVNDLIAKNLPPPEPIIDHLIERGSKMLLVSCAKGNKTWVFMDMGFCIARGMPTWWGMKCHQHSVLYINFELQEYYFGERMKEISRAHGMDKVDVPLMDVWNLRGCAQNYLLLCAQIKERLKKHPYALVIIDPYYKFSSSDKVENSAEDVAAVLNAMEDLACTLNIAIAFVHHTPKGDVSERSVVDLGSGSGVFGREPDLIIGLSQLKGSEDEFKAAFKFRNHPPRPDIGLRFKFPVMTVDETVSLSPTQEKDKDEMRVFALLPASGYRSKDWEQAAKEKLDMSRSTFQRHKSSLHMKDMVDCIDNIWVPMTPGEVGSKSAAIERAKNRLKNELNGSAATDCSPENE